LAQVKAQTKRGYRQSGQALVEFALVIPFLILVFMGIMDLGRGIYAYNVVASSAREGARYGITHPNDVGGIQNAALRNTAGLDPSAFQPPPTRNCSPNSDCSIFNNITVNVTYNFQPVTAFFTTITVKGVSTMMIETSN
jgi:Flp pilus assembly protein TadG